MTDTITRPDGSHIAFDDIGQGRPVVLTHGWIVGKEMWECVAHRLARAGHRVVSIDRRGCGDSSRPGSGFDLDTLADDLQAVMAELDLRDVTLAAHSVGGAEAVRCLSRHGAERIARLVLVATTTPGAPADQQPDDDAVAAALAGLDRDRPGYLRAGVPGFFGGPDVVSEALADWAVSLCLRASLTASVEVMVTGMRSDVAADVTALPVPTLVLHSASDPTAPLAFTGEPTAGLAPDAQLTVYDEGGHGLPLTHPDRVAVDIASFVGAGAPV